MLLHFLTQYKLKNEHNMHVELTEKELLSSGLPLYVPPGKKECPVVCAPSFVWQWPVGALFRWLFRHHSCCCPLQLSRQDPLEAILVIFGRRALIFFFVWKHLEKYENDTTFVRLRSCDHFETQKCRKRAPRSTEFNFFINCDRHKRFLQNERRRADLQNMASDF